jgi:hypothetical protein
MPFRFQVLLFAGICQYLHVWPDWIPDPLGIACCWLPAAPVWIETLFPRWSWWERRSRAVCVALFLLLSALIFDTAAETRDAALAVFGGAMVLLAAALVYRGIQPCDSRPRPSPGRFFMAIASVLVGLMAPTCSWSIPHAGLAVAVAAVPLCVFFCVAPEWARYYGILYCLLVASMLGHEAFVTSEPSWIPTIALYLCGAIAFVTRRLPGLQRPTAKAHEEISEIDDESSRQSAPLDDE